MSAVKYSFVFILMMAMIAGSLNSFAEVEMTKQEKKIAKIEEDIRLLTTELILTFTYEEASQIGAINYQDDKARNLSEKRLNKVEDDREKLIKKIQKKKEKLAKQQSK